MARRIVAYTFGWLALLVVATEHYPAGPFVLPVLDCKKLLGAIGHRLQPGSGSGYPSKSSALLG